MSMVAVIALDPFVTILPDGDCVSAVRGDRVMVPKDRAEKLVARGFARWPEQVHAPETKSTPPKTAEPGSSGPAAPAAKAKRTRTAKGPAATTGRD